MFAKPLERQLKILSSNINLKPPKKVAVSFGYWNHVVSTKILRFSAVLLVFLFFTVSTNGMTIQNSVLNTGNYIIDKDKGQDGTFRSLDWTQTFLKSCTECFEFDLVGTSSGSRKSPSLNFRHLESSPRLNKANLRCKLLSYSRCLFLHQLSKSITNERRRTTSEINSKLTADELRHQKPVNEASPLKASPPVRDLAKSRRKRLVGGDRRLVHLYCRTHFVLEILEDGRVVGSPMKSDSAILEIQSVKRPGVVRFYSPSTKHFLAMNNKGRLYGTKVYTEEHCAFIERLEENNWNTYSSTILPSKKKKRRRKGRKRSKRNADRAWYVAIGKTGKPRKANRIRPYQSSAQFLPRPLT